jgi:hypothetical protein
MQSVLRFVSRSGATDRVQKGDDSHVDTRLGTQMSYGTLTS